MEQLSDFSAVERVAHNIGRIIGALADQLLPRAADHSHATMTWDEEAGAFVGPALKAGLSLAFHPAEAQLFLRNAQGRAEWGMSLAGQSLEAIQQKLHQHLQLFALQIPFEVVEQVEYPYPALWPIPMDFIQGDMMPFRNQAEARTLANEVMHNFMEVAGIKGVLRIWPHNFDSGITEARSDGLEFFAGYAPGDEEAFPQPYYYLNAYLKGRKIVPEGFPKLPAGFWQLAPWQGAIFPLKEAWKQPDLIQSFLSEAHSAYLAWSKNGNAIQEN